MLPQPSFELKFVHSDKVVPPYDCYNALPESMRTFDLHEALRNESTKPHGGYPDHILYSSEWRVVSAGVVPTQSDHYLCWAELELTS